jgi:hypothetical protein
MHANNDERLSGAVDQEAFEKVIRDNLSPESVATIIAFLQPGASKCRQLTQHDAEAHLTPRSALQMRWPAARPGDFGLGDHLETMLPS